jgi:hypothetical protein
MCPVPPCPSADPWRLSPGFSGASIPRLASARSGRPPTFEVPKRNGVWYVSMRAGARFSNKSPQPRLCGTGLISLSVDQQEDKRWTLRRGRS